MSEISTDADPIRTPGEENRLSSRFRRWRPLSVIAVLLILTMLTLVKAVFLPLTVAFLASFLFRPLVRWLKEWHVPASLSSISIISILITVIAVAGVNLAEPFQEWMEKLPRAAGSLHRKVQDLTASFSSMEQLGKVVEEISNDGADKEVTRVKIANPSWAEWILTSIQEAIALWIVLILAFYFILTHGDRLIRNVVTLIPGLDDLGGSRNLIMGGDGGEAFSSDLMRDLEDMVSTYLVTITLINLLLGCTVAAAMYLIGMDAPLLWGTMAFLFNFLPYLGSFVGVVIIGLGSFVYFPDPAMAIWPPIIYATLTTLEGYVLTPLLLGWRLVMNPLVIFIWLLLLGWMWGILGALIAVPLLMVIKLLCSHIKSQRWVAALIES